MLYLSIGIDWEEKVSKMRYPRSQIDSCSNLSGSVRKNGALNEELPGREGVSKDVQEVEMGEEINETWLSD